MIRTAMSALLVLVFAGATLADDAKAVKSQMVKGTIKSADPTTNVLIVNQKVGTGVVDRELSITEKVEFVITTKEGTQEVSGKDGLKLLVDAKGASVQVKCDKDVNVLKVTVKISK
jgi:hypothetical protein